MGGKKCIGNLPRLGLWAKGTIEVSNEWGKRKNKRTHPKKTKATKSRAANWLSGYREQERRSLGRCYKSKRKQGRTSGKKPRLKKNSGPHVMPGKSICEADRKGLTSGKAFFNSQLLL